MVSHNAASLKEVITSNDHKEEFTLKTFNVMEVLRCSCAAQAPQLSVKNIMDTIPFLEEYLNNVIALISFLQNNSS